MYGQMTAGSWIYIGSQGIVQGTYECFAEIARRRFGGSLAGTITLTAGLGGMGGAQPLAVTMNEGVALCVEVDRDRIRRRLETRYLDEEADDLADAVERCLRAKRERRALSVGLCANAAEVLPELLRAGFEADVVTDQTSAHDPLGRLRARPGSDARRGRRAAPATTPTSTSAARARSAAAHCFAMVGFMDARRRGLRLRQQPARRGEARRLRARLRLPRLRARLHPAAVLRGQGPVPLGGAVGRPGRHRRHRPRRARRVPRRREPRALDPHGAASGSPSRGCRRGSAGSATASAAGSGCASTRWSASGELQRADRDRPRPPRLGLGRLALPRDRVDGRRLRRDRRLAAAQRARQHGLRARPGSASTTAAASGSAARSTPGWCAWPTAPTSPPRSSTACSPPTPAPGVIRHADAGYERAIEVAEERGVRIPMRERDG